MIRHLALILILAPAVALGRPPANVNHALSPWYQSLIENGTGVPCCAISDCRHYPTRMGATNWEVLIDGSWRPVPNDKVIHRKGNPTGEPVTCYYGGTIHCFVPGAEV